VAGARLTAVSSPTPVVIKAPETVTTAPPTTAEPAPRPGLTNRAAGRLRTRRALADVAADAPQDVGLAETVAERTEQDDADLRRAAFTVAVPSRRIAPAPRGAVPVDVGLSETRTERTAQDDSEVRAAAAAAPVLTNQAVGRLRPQAAPAAPADVGLAETQYERNGGDAADIATYVAAQGMTGTALIADHSGAEQRQIATPPTGAISTAAEMIAAARAAATALPTAQLAPSPLESSLNAIVGAERARTAAKQPPPFAGGRRMPPPRPVDPIEIDPVPEATHKIVELVNDRLPDLSLPAPRPMPDGTVPIVKPPKVIEAEELATELPTDETAAVVDAKNASEQAKRSDAIASANKPEQTPEPQRVAIDPPVLVDFRRPPIAVPNIAQDLADKANVAQALARVLVDTPSEAQTVVQAARNAAFPQMAQHFLEVTKPMEADVEKALCAEMDKLRDAVGLSVDQLPEALATRRTDLERIKSGQQAQSEMVTAAASRQLAEEAEKQRAKDEAAKQRAQQQLVRRLRAALHSSDPKLVDELVEQRMVVIDNDIGAGVAATMRAADRRLNLIKLYEEAYREAYRTADDASQAKMTEGEKHAVNENGRVWYNTAVDELHATMQQNSEATKAARDVRVENLRNAGIAARDALHAWADARTKAKLSADEQQERAATDVTRQQKSIDAALDAAAKADTRSDLLYQVHLVAAVYDQATKTTADQVTRQAGGLEDAAVQIGQQLLKGADPKDPIAAIAAGIRASFTKNEVAQLAPKIGEQIMAIEPKPNNVEDLAAVMFPGGSAAMDIRVDQLWTAFEGVGTDEDAVYAALGGLDKKQTELLGVDYAARHKGESLADRIDDEMSGDEYDRAIGLYRGDKVLTAKAVISQSEGWFSNDKQMAMDAIATLPPAQAAQVAADPEVKARLGRVLGDWRQNADGRYVPDDRAKLQLELVLELKKITPEVAAEKPGQVPTSVELTPQQRDLQARIDAIELDRSIRGHEEPNLDAMQKVYDRMRDTLQSDPRTANWSAAEFDNELRRRTRAMENAYEQEFAPELPKGGVSALRTALTQQLVGGEKLDIAVAQLNVDRAGELAGRLQLSTRGLYAADSDVNKALAANYERAYAEVQRSNACQGEVEQKYQELLRDHVAAGHRPSPEEQAAYKKEANEIVAMELAKQWFGDVNKRFDVKYGAQWGGTEATALENMLVDTTQFSGEKEAIARFKNGGGLTAAEQVRFGVAGWGMDRDQVVGAISGRTKEQLERISAEYQQKYDENMVERLKDESGGWDDSRENGPMERDAFDVREALRGVPTTSEEALAAAERRYNYEQDTYFKYNPLEREAAVGDQLQTMQRALNRAKDAHHQLEEARKRGEQGLIEQLETGFHNEQLGVLATADAYRKAVDDYVEGKVKIVAIVAAVVAGIVVEVLSGGTATPAVVALISSLAGTAASMATKADILGAAYGKQQIRNDLVVGAVDAVLSVLTARLGDVLLGVPKATGVTEAEVKASLKAIAAQRAAKPLIFRAAASTAQNFAQAAPTAMVAALLDPRTWKGDAGRTVLTAGVMAGATGSVVGGAIHGVTNAVGTAVRGVRGALGRNVGAEIAAESVVLRSTREALAEAHSPTGDRLARLGTPAERLAAQREYLARFPDKTPSDFRAALERGTAGVEAGAAEVRQLQREMTRELLSGIPARERGLYADTPLIVLSDAEFTARTGSRSRGQAATLVVNGQPVVVLREGAPLTALREEGLHVRQIRDSANALRVGLLDEARLAKWADASLEERIAGWNAKLDLEIEAQQHMIADLEVQLKRPGLDEAGRVSLTERLDDARAAHHTLSARRAELAALDQPTRMLIKAGELDSPGYLKEQPRLFSKKLDPNTVEPTGERFAELGLPQKDPKTGKEVVYVRILNKDRELLAVEQFEWDGRRAVLFSQEWTDPVTKHRFRFYDTVEGSIVVRSEQKYSVRRGTWVRSGSANRWGGLVPEMVAKIETAAKMGVDPDGIKWVQFEGQTKQGHGFDDVVFSLARSENGEVTARVHPKEIKDYPSGPVAEFSAIDKNFEKNLKYVRDKVQKLLTTKTWADAGLTEVEAQAVIAAIDARRIDIEVRTTAVTSLSGDPIADLQKSLRDRFGGEISVRRGATISDAARDEAAGWFNVLERYRLGEQPGGERTPARPGELEQFHTITNRPSGYTPDSIGTAEAVIIAARDPDSGIEGAVSWAPGGAHLVDDQGPLVVRRPSHDASGEFDAQAAARSLLDTASTPLPGRNLKSTQPRVIVDYDALKPGEVQALVDALRAEAKRRGQLDTLTRLYAVNTPVPPTRIRAAP
jgi:hypothetical protein